MQQTNQVLLGLISDLKNKKVKLLKLSTEASKRQKKKLEEINEKCLRAGQEPCLVACQVLSLPPGLLHLR